MSNQPKMHDYSGSQRGAGLSKKTVRLTIGHKGSGMVAADTQTVTIALATAADIEFGYHESYPGQLITPHKSTYAQGETVKVYLALQNVGDKAARGTVVVKDQDTGSKVTEFERPSWPAVINPGAKFSPDASVSIGRMPAHDWRLEFKVTP